MGDRSILAEKREFTDDYYTSLCSCFDPMDTSRIQLAKTLFDRALEVPAESREAYLREMCPGDPSLAEEVLNLLSSAAADDHFLSKAVSAPLSILSSERPTQSYRIGPYRVERLIGRGGMGEVWQGMRDDGAFRKVVAIKIMTMPVEGAGRFLDRFRQERQVLASLDHPGIARILDGGELPDGRPYMVMDYVEGLPLDRHCHQRKATVHERIELMIQVCEAVEYLHSMGVIHRDLKPGNILVTPAGSVKLLDFGIARVNTAGQDQALTAPQQRLLTPGFASPEQLAGETCTARSDIYSLGAVLYVLLTQQTPSMSAPTAPSGMLTTLADGTAKAAPRLARHMLGDLDGVAMKALERNPAHRYQSAREFAADLRRFLEGLPVKARSAPWPERVARFVGRRRGYVAVAGIVAVLIVFGAVQTYRGWRAQISSEAVGRQFALLASQIPKTAITTSMSSQEIEVLLGEVRRLRVGLEGIVKEPAPSAEAAREKRRMAVREIAGFLDRTIPLALTKPALAHEVGRTYQAAAEARPIDGESSKPETIDLLGKAGFLMKTAQSNGFSELGLQERIAAVEKRTQSLGGDVAAIQNAIARKWTPAAVDTAQDLQPQQSTGAEQNQAKRGTSGQSGRKNLQSEPPPVPGAAAGAGQPPSGWQERLISVSAKAAGASQALEQRRLELAAGGLSLNADIWVSNQQMQSCLESAKLFANSGQWEQAEDYLARTGAYAERILRALGR